MLEHFKQLVRDFFDVPDNGSIDDIKVHVSWLERRVGDIETDVSEMLVNYRNYKSRTREELELMESEISRLIDKVESIEETLNDEVEVDLRMRVQRPLSRLRNNYTRITSALASYN